MSSPFDKPVRGEEQPITLEALAAQMTKLTEIVGKIATGVTSPAETEDLSDEEQLIKFLNDIGVSAETEEKQPGETPPEETGNIDKMTQSELTSTIMKEINDKGFSPMYHEILGIKMRMAVTEARGKHEDFDKYGEFIQAYLGKNPGTPVEDVYHLVKAKVGPIEGNSSDKEKSEEEKLAEEKENITPLNKAEEEKPPVRTIEELANLPAGERPSGGSTEMHPSDDDISVSSAAESAADEVFGKTGV